ncbi:hypothetical protein WJX73_009537 [Symbiochloris irregularis]|uniref:protein-serine/threonine phosphatase n=1 Tax=Symbiochloris irregularis TaxID=706552 RepID=A0AAW1NS96_9CHLO
MGGCTSRDADTLSQAVPPARDATLQKPMQAAYQAKDGAAVKYGRQQVRAPASDRINGKEDQQPALGDQQPILQPAVANTALQGPFLTCKAAGVTHIGYGPLKRENQDSICMEEHSRLGPGRSFYGVFDGHGSVGKPISQQASQMLPHFLGLGLDGKGTAASHEDIATALSSAFLATENDICNSTKLDAQNSGTTATVALLQGEDLDAPGLLLSRAIGDQLATTVGCIATPEIMHLTMQRGQDCFLVMASDGIWDVLTQDQVAATVRALTG